MRPANSDPHSRICVFTVRLKTNLILSYPKIHRKEGNDQESIQLPDTFRSKTPKGKKDAPKVTASQSKHYKQKTKRTVSTINGQTAIQNIKKKITNTYTQRHKMTYIVDHSRCTVLESSVKILLGVGRLKPC